MLYGLYNLCTDVEKGHGLYTYQSLASDLSLNNMLFAILVLFFRKDDDILQGINRLDYLMKVSLFQIYKDDEK